jgi:hypothetical protein
MKVSSGSGDEEPDDPASRAKRIARSFPGVWGGCAVNDKPLPLEHDVCEASAAPTLVPSVQIVNEISQPVAVAVKQETSASPGKSSPADSSGSDELEIARHILQKASRSEVPRRRKEADMDKMQENMATLVRSVESSAKCFEAISAAMVTLATAFQNQMKK